MPNHLDQREREFFCFCVSSVNGRENRRRSIPRIFLFTVLLQKVFLLTPCCSCRQYQESPRTAQLIGSGWPIKSAQLRPKKLTAQETNLESDRITSDIVKWKQKISMSKKLPISAKTSMLCAILLKPHITIGVCMVPLFQKISVIPQILVEVDVK